MHANLIAGEWVAGATTVEDRNPSDLSDVVGEFAVADEAQVDAAIEAAAAAAPAWAATTPQERFTILETAGLDVDYVAVAPFHPPTLAAAVRVGSTRLIDNVPLEGDEA